ncbi:MAG: hypothetical protein ACR2P0_05205 [Acidimicrobiales bacterium]
MIARARAHPRRVFALVFAAVAAYRFLLWALYMRLIPLTGDEAYYHRGASITHRWIRGVAEAETALDRIVAKGWFMPGPIGHLLPARRLTNDIGLLRLWQGTVDLGLLAVTTFVVSRMFGRKVALGYLLVIGFMPDPATQSFTLWGEAHGSKVLILAFLLTVLLLRDHAAWTRARTLVTSAAIGALVAWAIYLRPPFLLQAGAVAVAIVLVLGGRRDGVRLRHATVAGVTVILVVLGLLLPWSIQVSQNSGGFVLTTNTVDVNLIQAFSDPEDLERVIGSDDFGQIEAYLRQRMRDTGESYVDALANTRGEFMANVSIREYLDRADTEITSYLSEDESFLERYELILTRDPEIAPAADFVGGFRLLHWMNVAFWYPVALTALWALVRPTSLWHGTAFTGILARIAIPAAMIQPWLSNAKFRHIGAILPLIVLVALITVAGIGIDDPVDDRMRFHPWARAAGRAIQIGCGVFLVVTVAVFVT